MFKQPDPTLALRLQAAINTDIPPQNIFYDFLSSGSVGANIFVSQIQGNKEVIRIITSPRGRAWIKKHLDGFLNYLEKFKDGLV